MIKKIKPFLPLIIATVIITLVSTFHVITLFTLSNNVFIGFITAAAFETVAIGSLIALFFSGKKIKTSLWVIFITVAIFQIIGNSYYAFDFISDHLTSDPTWLDNWINFLGKPILDLFTTFLGDVSSPIDFHKRFLSLFTGGLLPVLYLASTHIIFKELTDNEKEDIFIKENEPEQIPKIEQTQDELDKVISELNQNGNNVNNVHITNSNDTTIMEGERNNTENKEQNFFDTIKGQVKNRSKGFLGRF